MSEADLKSATKIHTAAKKTLSPRENCFMPGGSDFFWLLCELKVGHRRIMAH